MKRILNRNILILLVAGALIVSGQAYTLTESPFPAVYVTRLTNIVLANNVPLAFDSAPAANATYGSWSSADPTKLVIAKTGWYLVGVDLTTLGTNYNGPDNSDWVGAVGRNGVDLAHLILGQRHDHSSGGTADLMSFSSPVRLTAADYLQLIVQNPLASGLLVESNVSVPPTSGSDYTTRPGTGVIGPHLYAIYQGP